MAGTHDAWSRSMHTGAVEQENGTSAITVLERHDRQVSMLLGEIVRLDRPSKARADLCKALSSALTTHLLLDERHVRPVISGSQRATVDVAARARRRHVERMVADLGRLNASPLLSVTFVPSLRARIEEHFAAHQLEVPRALRGSMSDAELGELGDALQAAMRDIERGVWPVVITASRGVAIPARRTTRAAVGAVSRRLEALAG